LKGVYMLNTQQIKLVQTAVRVAGLREKNVDGRYRLLLAQYKQPNGRPVKSCKQLNNSQLEDLLAICEAHGWRMPGKTETFYREKVFKNSDYASYAQREAIKHLAGDLGWQDYQLAGMLRRMTGEKKTSLIQLTPAEAYNIIEALKIMLGRERGKQYTNLKEVQKDMEVATDGQASQIG